MNRFARLWRATIFAPALLLAFWLSLAIAMPAQAQTMVQVTVQPGDTLSRIATRNCTTWQEIYSLNQAVIGPNPSVITAGTVLTVPNRCGGNSGGNTGGVWDRGPRVHATGTFNAPWYTVAPGDTLTSIAQRFGTTVATIRSQNNLSSNTITPGQRLFIGGGGAQPPAVTPTPRPPQPPPQPTPLPGNTERVRFEPYAISATRTGMIQGDIPMRYILGAQRGQSMSIFTQSFGPPLVLSVIDPTGQAVALWGVNGATSNSVSALLPATGDYLVVVAPLPDGVSRFSFNFNITFVIQ